MGKDKVAVSQKPERGRAWGAVRTDLRSDDDLQLELS